MKKSQRKLSYVIFTLFVLSNFLSFGILKVQASDNPVPTLTSISPNTAVAGGGSFTLTATGTNFVNNSVIYWNGAPLVTTYIGATSLTATISSANIASTGPAFVYVLTPTPGGGMSNAQNFVAYSSTIYSASDALGQTDDNGNPNFTKSLPGNSTNKNGLYKPQYIAMDSVHHRLFVSDAYRVLVYNLDSSNNSSTEFLTM